MTIKNTNKEYFNEINIMRGIAVFCVVIGHSFSSTVEPSILGFLKDFVYCFHMPAFFFISGFLSQRKEMLTIQEKYKRIRKKAFRLLIPYFFLTVVTIILKVIFGTFAKNPLKYDSLFIDILIGRNNPNGGLWFLYTLFAISAIGIILSEIDVRKIFGIMCLLYIANIIFFEQNGHILAFILSYGWLYFGGAIFRLYYKKIRDNIQKIDNIMQFVIGVTINVALIFISYWNIYYLKNWILFVVIMMMGIFSLLIFSCKINQNKIPGNTAFTILGNYGMDIYMVGYYVQQSVYVMFGKILGVNYNIYSWCMLISGLILPIFISKYIIKKYAVLRMLVLGEK